MFQQRPDLTEGNAMATDSTIPVTPTSATSSPTQTQNFIDAFNQAGDAVLESIAQSQELILAAAKQATANLPQVPEVALPFTGEQGNVPSAKELVDVSFTFADKWLATQKSFAEKYLALTTV